MYEIYSDLLGSLLLSFEKIYLFLYINSSVAVSIKMNVLLTAPALAAIWLLCSGIQSCIINVAVCAAVQVRWILKLLLVPSENLDETKQLKIDTKNLMAD